MVSPDTAGVPSGGKYGDVPWFTREAGRHGLKVGWCVMGECFGIYTQEGLGKYTFQMQWRNQVTGEAKPLTADFLWLLLWMWDRHSRTSGETLLKDFHRLQAEAKQQDAKERYELASQVAEDAVNEMYAARERGARKLISVPQMVGIGHG